MLQSASVNTQACNFILYINVFSFNVCNYLQVMDSLPHFCRKGRSGSSRHAKNGNTENCFSLDSAFHQQLYSYIQQQGAVREPIVPIKQGSFHVDFPEPDPRDLEIAKTIETEFHKLENHNELSYSMNGLHQVNGEL